MTTSSNAYCAALGIRAPRVEDARSSPDANYPEAIEASQRRIERERAAHADQLVRMRRVLNSRVPAGAA